jgi:kynurenine 3-monooxygenase
MKRRVLIAGAGPVGCLVARVFAERGFQVDLYDKRSTARTPSSGRTINLSISPRGIAALDHFGVGHAVLAASVPMCARVFHPLRGAAHKQPYGHPDWRTYSIERDTLNEILLSAALRSSEVRVHWGHTCLHADLNGPALIVRDPDGRLDVAEGDLIIGADGSASAVRSALLCLPHVSFAKSVFPGAYRELALRSQGGNAIHIWPRGDFFLAALPNLDGGMRGTLVIPDSRRHEISRPDTILRFLNQYLPDILPDLAESPEQISQKPFGEIVTVRCEQYHLAGRLLLMGDAAHAMVPFMGQGVNFGLEDCLVLARLMDEHGMQLDRAFDSFTRFRVPEALACSDLSEWNLKELLGGRPNSNPANPPLVVEVNFSGQPCATIAARTIPGWSPRVNGHDSLPASTAGDVGDGITAAACGESLSPAAFLRDL